MMNIKGQYLRRKIMLGAANQQWFLCKEEVTIQACFIILMRGSNIAAHNPVSLILWSPINLCQWWSVEHFLLLKRSGINSPFSHSSSFHRTHQLKHLVVAHVKQSCFICRLAKNSHLHLKKTFHPLGDVLTKFKEMMVPLWQFIKDNQHGEGKWNKLTYLTVRLLL